MKDEIPGIQKLAEPNRQICRKSDQKWAQKIQIFIEGENQTKSKYLMTKIIWKQLRYVCTSSTLASFRFRLWNNNVDFLYK